MRNLFVLAALAFVANGNGDPFGAEDKRLVMTGVLAPANVVSNAETGLRDRKDRSIWKALSYRAAVTGRGSAHRVTATLLDAARGAF